MSDPDNVENKEALTTSAANNGETEPIASTLNNEEKKGISPTRAAFTTG